MKPKSQEVQEFMRYIDALYVMAQLEEKQPHLKIRDEHSGKSSKVYFDVEFRPHSRAINLEIREDRDGSLDYIRLHFYTHQTITRITKRLRKIGVYVYQLHPFNVSFNISTVEQMKTILSWYNINLEEN